MAEITAAMVKALREDTGQGMMECKKALQEAGGDVEQARDILRKKGLVKAEKKADRATSEGLIAIKAGDGSAVMVEARCETDFCARNEQFQTMLARLVELADQAPAGPVEATDAMRDAVQAALAKIGENMSYARGVKIQAQRIGTYLHHNRKVGVIVGLDRDLPDEVVNDLCMHIAFADPMGIRPEDIPAALVEKEKQFARQEAIDSGKSPEIAEKMVTGKIRKFVADRALLEQVFVRDDKKKVKDILGGAAVTAFARFAVGT
jgi:elongation factor Ts